MAFHFLGCGGQKLGICPVTYELISYSAIRTDDVTMLTSYPGQLVGPQLGYICIRYCYLVEYQPLFTLMRYEGIFKGNMSLSRCS